MSRRNRPSCHRDVHLGLACKANAHTHVCFLQLCNCLGGCWRPERRADAHLCVCLGPASPCVHASASTNMPPPQQLPPFLASLAAGDVATLTANWVPQLLEVADQVRVLAAEAPLAVLHSQLAGRGPAPIRHPPRYAAVRCATPHPIPLCVRACAGGS